MLDKLWDLWVSSLGQTYSVLFVEHTVQVENSQPLHLHTLIIFACVPKKAHPCSGSIFREMYFLGKTSHVYQKNKQSPYISISIFEPTMCSSPNQLHGHTLPTFLNTGHGGMVSILFDLWFETVSLCLKE